MYREMPVTPAPYNRFKKNKDKSKEDAKYASSLFLYLFLDDCETPIYPFRIVHILYSISRPLLAVGTKVMQA